MKVWKSYFAGLKEATLRPKMIFVLYLVQFLFASAIYFLVSGFWNNSLGASLAADSMEKTTDMDVVFDALLRHGGRVETIMTAALVLVFFTALTSLLLKGGILYTLRHSVVPPEEGYSRGFLSRFLAGAGLYFGRFFRLWVLSLGLWAVFVLINLVLQPVGKWLTAGGSREHMLVYVFLGRVGIGLFLVLLIKMILDYTRIKIVVEDSRRVLPALGETLEYVARNAGKTLVLFYLLLVTGVALAALFWVVKTLVPSASLAGAAAGFLVGQAFLYVRCWSNVSFQAGQLSLYEETE